MSRRGGSVPDGMDVHEDDVAGEDPHAGGIHHSAAKGERRHRHKSRQNRAEPANLFTEIWEGELDTSKALGAMDDGKELVEHADSHAHAPPEDVAHEFAHIDTHGHGAEHGHLGDGVATDDELDDGGLEKSVDAWEHPHAHAHTHTHTLSHTHASSVSALTGPRSHARSSAPPNASPAAAPAGPFPPPPSSGRWSKAEDAALLAAWDEYAAAHRLAAEDRARLVMAAAKSERPTSDPWLPFVASRLKHRSIRSVYRRSIRLLHSGNYRGALTTEEKETLRKLVAEHGQRWAFIGKMMNRLPQTLENAWDLTMRGSFTTGAWSAAEEQSLVQLVRTKAVETTDGGYTNIPWVEISRALSSRSALQCQSKWTHCGWGNRQLSRHWGEAQDRQLIGVLAATPAASSEAVAWNRIMPSWSSQDTQRAFNRLLKRVPFVAGAPFSDQVAAIAALQEANDTGVRPAGDAVEPATDLVDLEDMTMGEKNDVSDLIAGDVTHHETGLEPHAESAPAPMKRKKPRRA